MNAFHPFSAPGPAREERSMRALLPALAIAATLAAASASTAATAPAVPHGITLDGLQDWLPAGAAFNPGVALPANRITTM
jgi:hypothetical protein